MELELVIEKNNKLQEFGIETKGQIVDNCKNLINNLPPNSPYRRPLLVYLIKGLEMRKVIEVFQILERSYWRILRDTENTLIETKYSVGVTKTKIK